jgi:DNA-directed RNA polymerase specialized sigma24 family protein
MDQVDTLKEAIFEEVDWSALYRRLRVYAFRLGREMPSVFDGISADDLVGETLTTFLAAPDCLGWDPTTEDNLAKFLFAVLKHKFMTHRRRSLAREGAADNRQAPIAIGSAPSRETISDRVREVARGDKDLEELVEASQRLEEGLNINQQLSERLNITVQDVINRKRRLRRSLRKSDWPGRRCIQTPPGISL